MIFGCFQSLKGYVYRLFCMAYFYIDVSEFGFRITKETNMKMFVKLIKAKNGNFYF